MNLTIRAHHTSAMPDFREHAEKKLERLDRYLPRVGEIVVEVGHEETRAAAHRYTVQVTVHAGAAILRAEERNADPRVAFDAAAATLSRQAQRHSKRLHDRHRAGGGRSEDVAGRERRPDPRAAERDVEPDEVEEYIAGRVVRVKRLDVKPMSEEEALAQMDLLGHDFFLFLDSTTSDYALLYKRRDGGYGMLAASRG